MIGSGATPCLVYIRRGTVGTVYNITDGVLRKPYALGTHGSDADEIAIELWPTSYVLGKGHRLRLDISSSNYPHFDRNPNTGRTISPETAPVTPQQTIYHDAKRPSHFVLPFVSK
ncbi:MAG TPA: CocE/NonD family hydrolase [Terriglobales bacterium]|nr:CocE/NonD family hydrolase [Terriglobales bacterium]